MKPHQQLHFNDPIIEAGVSGLAQLFRSGACSPAAATAAYLARIQQHNPALGAYVDLDAAGARRAATASTKRWASGQALSAIDGVPLAIKANIAVRGLPWTAGVGALRQRIASQDADCVARLRAAGAIILGTVNMDEAALGATCDNPWFGRTHNPYRHDYTAGGSSGGAAAAVAAGLCAAALGSDTMGSVRIPAAYCGVHGLYPEANRISHAGVTPLSWSFDNVGVLTRSVRDSRRLIQIFPRAPGEYVSARTNTRPGHTLAALILPESVDADVGTAYAATLASARAAGWRIKMIPLNSYNAAIALKQLLLVVEAEGYVEYEDLMPRGSDDTVPALSPSLRDMLGWGARQPASKLAGAYRQLAQIRAAIRAELRGYAGLITPTTPQTAFDLNGPVPRNQALFTGIGSIARLSGVSLPIQMGTTGLPHAVQILSWNDAMALRLAEQLGHLLPGVNPPPDFLA